MKKEQKQKLPLKNQEIRVPFVTLITDSGEKIDSCPIADALKKAYDIDLDLVIVSSNVTPPIAKIMDWGKYKYELSKKQEQSKKLSKAIEIKEMRIRPKTDSHDIEIKLKKIKEFIEKGHKVKVVMMFRGRENAFLDRGRESMMVIIKSLSEIAKTEEPLKYQFKRLSTTLAPAQVAQGKKDSKSDNQ